MKVIINIDDDNFSYLNQLTKQDNTTIDHIINELIKFNITDVNKAYQQADKQALNEFAKIAQKYFHEDIASIYDVLGTSEEVETDRRMLNVYEKLYQDIFQRDGVMLELFQEYKKRRS
ncbi:hypothetical protein [Staphylococcus delphini]|uniref:Phage protein n=1 Tax=Staphylococcus delphini TaxID=53344 RepID=A0AAX0QSV0_9STAP|nr:hypothetical protein [Staphylococcus delphini]PCF50142.1 hypothetical protein B5C07_08010 [Staphylococcus delphini]PNZ95763.1 hypothetical protein CD148_03550 [Staphylococcus delphini]RIZ56226.1 hypothetical protein CDL68_01415 [Staphylococcus delphini]VED62452.1 Uncharacterised protein [Staphylococcus delphini]